MKTVGIIAEYNPFHNGHLYHLKKSRELSGAEYAVAVMGGNFTQRGEPAMADKWLRAAAAVACGVDLVVELPFAFACNSAEYFAKGAVEILNGLGCVDALSFGSESGSLAELEETAGFLTAEPQGFQEALKRRLAEGLSYPKARSLAVEESLSREAAACLLEPNHILAVEYLKQLYLTESPMTPFTVKRRGTGYHDNQGVGCFASAAAIRERWGTAGEQEIWSYMPPQSLGVYKRFKGKENLKLNDFYPLITAEILRSDREALSEIFAAGEGLENRLKSVVRMADSAESLVDAVISKRYTRTRINRLLVQLLLRLTKESLADILGERLYYARVLAFSDAGASLLKEIKKSDRLSIPLITNLKKEVSSGNSLWKSLRFDVLASDLYNLIAGNDLYGGSDYVRGPRTGL